MAFGFAWSFIFSVLLWFYAFGYAAVLWNLLHTSFYFHLCGIFGVFFLVYYYRLPSPSEEAICEVLGPDACYVDCDPTVKDAAAKPFVMRVIGHRGGSFDAPENSLVAFRNTKEKGGDTVEFDLAFTADDVPILFHDEKIDRVINCTGYIAHMTWGQIKDFNLSEKHPLGSKFSRQRIALFEDGVKECLRLDLRMIIDVKVYDQRACDTILGAFASCPFLYKRVIVSCFNPWFVYKIRKEDPNIICALAWSPHCISYNFYSGVTGERDPRFTNICAHLLAQLADVLLAWSLRACLAPWIGLSCVLMHKDALNSGEVERWRRNGVRTIAWTVNHPVEKQYCGFTLHIPYITDTFENDPVLMLNRT